MNIFIKKKITNKKKSAWKGHKVEKVIVLYFFGGARGSNHRPYIYYVLSLPSELSSRATVIILYCFTKRITKNLKSVFSKFWDPVLLLVFLHTIIIIPTTYILPACLNFGPFILRHKNEEIVNFKSNRVIYLFFMQT